MENLWFQNGFSSFEIQHFRPLFASETHSLTDIFVLTQTDWEYVNSTAEAIKKK